jgi:hypothetical protein
MKIPGALGYGGPAKIVVPTLTCSLIVGIVLKLGTAPIIYVVKMFKN